MDGHEATKAIRAESRTRTLPIVALTAATIDEGRRKAMEAGATEYRTKPIRRDELLEICKMYLKPSGMD
jgi:CheY-like chemotaxis protein